MIWIWIKYLALVIGGYLISIIIKHILDKNINRFRIDNYLLYLLLVKSPTASTKIIFKSQKRPDINKIKKDIEKEFQLDKNEQTKGNSYLFKIRKNPTPLKISIIEPDETNLFTIILETFGEDKLPKIFKGSFYNTINNLEKINKRLSNLNLKSINILINLSCYLDKEDNITYSCSKNVSMSLKTISCNSKNFTDIEPLVKKCLKKWRNKFI